MVRNYTKLLIFIFLITIKYELSKAQERWLYNFSEYNKALFGFVITSINVDQLSSCITMCERNNNCASINFDLTTLICELNRSTKRAYPEKIGERGNTLYMEIRGQDWVRVQGSGCGLHSTFNLTGPVSGYIWSPLFPSSSDHFLNCHWNLTSNTDIGIRFKAFSTEQCCDKVRIFTSNSSSSGLLGEFSGEAIPQPMYSSKTLYINYATDYNEASPGFLATFQAGSRT